MLRMGASCKWPFSPMLVGVSLILVCGARLGVSVQPVIGALLEWVNICLTIPEKVRTREVYVSSFAEPFLKYKTFFYSKNYIELWIS